MSSLTIPVGFCPICCYPRMPGLDLVVDCKDEAPWEPFTTDRVVDIGIDRQSFLDRGWTDEQLGAWNRGSRIARRGVFLSLYYAIENKNPNHPNHPWREEVGDQDRGFGAHIDYWSKHERGLDFRLHAYDNPNPPTKRGVVVARRKDEEPFKSHPGAIGHAGTFEQIYILADGEPPNPGDPDFVAGFALGRRTDEPSWIWKDEGGGRRSTYTNFTHLLAHEVGHFFGLPHINDENSAMFCSIGSDKVPRWQSPQSTNDYFKRLAGKLKA